MKAVVFQKPNDVRVETVDDPELEQLDDIIRKVTSTAICGSDLHIHNGFIPKIKPMVIGHEFVGVVVEVGAGVKEFRPGDRVVVPFPIACGGYFFCNHDLPDHCENSNENCGPEGGLAKEKGGALFGYTDLYGGYSGGQSEYVRVPYANFSPRKVPDRFTDEQVLFLTDIFPTGFSGVEWAGVKGGETVAVFGCGPVGLMAQRYAWVRGAGKVIGLDREPYRLKMARRSAGSEVINVKETDAVEAIRSMTDGHSADVCIDAVGMEVDRSLLQKAANITHAEAGSISVMRNAFSAVRRGGTVSILGVDGMPDDNFPIGQIFDKGLTLRCGQAPVHCYIDELMTWLDQETIVLDDIITQRLPLADAPQSYEMFNNKEDGCVKVVLNRDGDDSQSHSTR